jgi:hypothetical protein
VLAGTLDDEGAAAEHPLEQALGRLDVIDLGERNAPLLAAEHALAEEDLLGREDVVGAAPDHERREGQPQEDDQRPGADSDEGDVAGAHGQQDGGGGDTGHRDHGPEERRQHHDPVRMEMKFDLFTRREGLVGESHANLLVGVHQTSVAEFSRRAPQAPPLKGPCRYPPPPT